MFSDTRTSASLFPMLEWATEHLHKAGYINTSFTSECIADTEYSCVYKLSGADGSFFLKRCPEKFYVEPSLIKYFSNLGCSGVPSIIAENKQLHCFLMHSVGDKTIKALCEAYFDESLILRSIRQYTQIQRACEKEIKTLFSFGLEDWQLTNFSTLCLALIKQRSPLIDAGLTTSEYAKLLALFPLIEDVVETLAKYKLPATISHCDFHLGNTIYDTQANRLTIIDWGETVISHPFFSLCGFLWNLTYWFKLAEDDEILIKCRREAINAWRSCYDEETLMMILNKVNQLSPLCAALSYYQLHKFAQLNPVGEKRNYMYSIVDCLKSYVNNNYGSCEAHNVG
ncbi:aminoglycoside phosphotransferase family protein [Thiotrichales bacterium 19S11-10]|nr:aminoglycoside phosphotransferase family protein [Thiotrichales bacterium 19S11-10]